MQRYIIGVAKVNIDWVAVEASNLDEALAKADEGSDVEELDESSFSHNLETEEFKVRLPNGDEVSAEEAIDLEASDERVGE
jgi:hypothetical protein